jgi:hypothetical protein
MLYGKAIFSLLTNDATLNSLVGSKVFPVVAGNNTSFPFLVYNITTAEPQNTKQELSSADIINFQVSSYALNHGQAAELAEAVRVALEKQSGTIEGIPVIDIVPTGIETMYDQDQDVHHFANDFEMFINR